MAADDAGPACFSDSIQLVDKNDARCSAFGLSKQVADSGRADADEHLQELGTANAEEGTIRSPRHGLSQERLARARRTDQKNALGDTSTQGLIFLRRL